MKTPTLVEAKEGLEMLKGRMWEGLHEDISEVVCAGDTSNVNSAILSAFPDVVKAYINVFALSMVHRVIS